MVPRNSGPTATPFFRRYSSSANQAPSNIWVNFEAYEHSVYHRSEKTWGRKAVHNIRYFPQPLYGTYPFLVLTAIWPFVRTRARTHSWNRWITVDIFSGPPKRAGNNRNSSRSMCDRSSVRVYVLYEVDQNRRSQQYHHAPCTSYKSLHCRSGTHPFTEAFYVRGTAVE